MVVSFYTSQSEVDQTTCKQCPFHLECISDADLSDSHHSLQQVTGPSTPSAAGSIVCECHQRVAKVRRVSLFLVPWMVKKSHLLTQV
eukprot:c6825_g1_i1 orf=29-289(-)